MSRLDELAAQQEARKAEAARREQDRIASTQAAEVRKAEVQRLWDSRLSLLDQAVNKVNARLNGLEVECRSARAEVGEIFRAELKIAGDRHSGLGAGALLRISAGGETYVHVTSENVSPWTTRTAKIEDIDADFFETLVLDVVDAKLNPARSPGIR